MKYRDNKTKKTVKAFQLGVDEIPVWFIDMMRRGKFELWRDWCGEKYTIFWIDDITGKSFEAAYTNEYIIKDSKDHITVYNSSDFNEAFTRKVGLYGKIKNRLLRKSK